MKFKIAFIVILAGILGFLIFYQTGKDPEKAEAYLGAGKSKFTQGDVDGAIKDYKKGIRNNPNSSDAYNLLGMAYRSKYFASKRKEKSYYRKAVKNFKKSIKANPRNWYPQINLGTTMYYNGDKKGAVPHLKKGIELNPQHLEAKKILEMIEKGEKE